MKSTHAPAILRKDTIGITPKFTFSTYKLACKKRRNYIFCCTVSGCKKVFNSVKNWNSHHLCLHRAIRYKCNICSKWIATRIGLKITNTFIRKHGLSVVIVINPSIFWVDLVYTGTYTAEFKHMNALPKIARNDISGHKIY